MATRGPVGQRVEFDRHARRGAMLRVNKDRYFFSDIVNTDVGLPSAKLFVNVVGRAC